MDGQTQIASQNLGFALQNAGIVPINPATVLEYRYEQSGLWRSIDLASFKDEVVPKEVDQKIVSITDWLLRQSLSPEFSVEFADGDRRRYLKMNVPDCPLTYVASWEAK